MSKLKSLHQKDKRAFFTYKDTTLVCELRLLQRGDIEKINEKAVKMQYDPKLGGERSDFDADLFAEEVAKHCLVGWKGLTFRVAVDLLPLDESGLDDLDEEIEYTEEDALELMAEAPKFTEWVLERARHLENFRRYAD